jgi:site-specific recombinase XerD
MLLILLYETAARVSEITGLTLGQLHLSKPGRIILTGKRNKTRIVPITDQTTDHLHHYLDEFHPPASHPAPSTPLFYSLKQGQPAALSTDTVATVLTQAANTARPTCPDIPDRVHCHLLRKTRAMDLYTDGIPLPLIMQMLGHESMSTTSTFYAFATMKMMTDAIQAANPAAISEPPAWKEQTILNALHSL